MMNLILSRVVAPQTVNRKKIFNDTCYSMVRKTFEDEAFFIKEPLQRSFEVWEKRLGLTLNTP